LSLHYTHDYVSINGQRYCGSRQPKLERKGYKRATVVFKSDTTIQMKGFKLKYRTVRPFGNPAAVARPTTHRPQAWVPPAAEAVVEESSYTPVLPSGRLPADPIDDRMIDGDRSKPVELDTPDTLDRLSDASVVRPYQYANGVRRFGLRKKIVDTTGRKTYCVIGVDFGCSKKKR